MNINLNYNFKIYYLVIFILLLVIINILFNQELFNNNNHNCSIIPKGPCDSKLCPDGCKPKLFKENDNDNDKKENKCICVKRE